MLLRNNLVKVIVIVIVIVLVFIVLGSDFASGIFSLVSNSCSSKMDELSIPWNITILRSGGNYESVSVEWEIEDLNGYRARQDFLTANGSLQFEEGESIKVMLRR